MAKHNANHTVVPTPWLLLLTRYMRLLQANLYGKLVALLTLSWSLWSLLKLQTAFSAVDHLKVWEDWPSFNHAPALEAGIDLDTKAPDRRTRASKYSIILSTYTRYELLLQSLDHYGRGEFPNLDAIFIAWGLGQVNPPSSLNLSLYNVPVYLERAQVNSLTERFRRPEGMATTAALWIDDDILVSGQGTEYAFRAWQAFGQKDHRILGFSGRSHKVENNVYYYLMDTVSHSMVLTDSAFMDTTMLEWFWAEDKRIQRAIQYVDERMNCEDILMNYVVSMNNHLPPLMLDLPNQVRVVRSKGLHDNRNHFYERATCIREFNKLFGDVLQRSDITLGRATAGSRRLVDIAPQYWLKDEEDWGLGKTFEGASRAARSA